MNFDRRDILKLSAMGAVSVMGGSLIKLSYADDGFIELETAETDINLVGNGGAPSSLWCYNGASPGPEIRVKQGDLVKVRLINRLPEATSIHWHGIRIDNAMDGVSGLTQEAVPPGESFEYIFKVPDAGTFWYHAHNKSWNQVARGLYGTLIVEEPEPVFDAEHDLTYVIDDWRVKSDGSLDVESLGSLMEWTHGGRLGNWLTVNGKPPQQEVILTANEAYRIRLINAANSRIFKINPKTLSGKIIAIDGQPLKESKALSSGPLRLGPAQRMDFMITPEEDNGFPLEEISGGNKLDMIRFNVTAPKEVTPQQKKALPVSIIPQPDIDNAKAFRLNMTGGAMGGGGSIIYQGRKLASNEWAEVRQAWAFNGVANLAVDPFFSVTVGDTVIVEVLNNTVFDHAMHTHGHHFKIIERSEIDDDESDAWRDTFLIGPRQKVKLAFVADNPGKWLFHCHMLEHAAAGMNTWFEVV